jgi:beta-galactosidase
MSALAPHHPIPKLPRVLFGGDYNPEQWPPEVWREDARLMREAGVSLVTVGVFAWAWLEPEEGRLEFGWLDEVLDLLHAHGVGVNLATATATPPAWLVRKHPEILPVLANGAVLDHGGRQHYAPWSSVYRRHAAPLVRRLAERYGRHPALASWHINNELACHVRESFDAETEALWREWLRRRHGDVARLNQAWNTAFWSQRYTRFEEVGVPRMVPALLNPGMALDWRRFSAEAFLDIVRREKAILRELTPDIPINTNYVGWHDLPYIDHRAVAAELDYVSWDSYPDPADGLAAVQANALCHDFMRSLKPGRPFVLMEQATSGLNWRPFNQPRGRGVARAFSHQAVARGADGCLFFQWRQSACGAEQFHSSLVPITGIEVGGRENRVWTLTRQLGRDMAALAPVAGSTIRAQAALLVDYESIWATEHDGKPLRLDVRDEIARAHRPLWRRNVAVDVRHPDDDLSAYRVLIAPALMVLSPAAIGRLRDFVARGGHLLFTPFSSVTDGTTRFHAGGFPGGLADLFGFALEEWWPVAPERRGAVRGPDGPWAWTRFAELGHATHAEVLARFADEDELDGRPALTRARVAGGGSAWYLAARLEPAAMDEALGLLLAEAGLRGVAETPEGVEATLRESAGERFLHLVNHTPNPARVCLPAACGPDLLGGPAPRDGVLDLPAWGVAAIRIEAAST